MAKRGYRGKHPHNDMKVSNPSTNKYSAKLNDEYNVLENEYTLLKKELDFYKEAFKYPNNNSMIFNLKKVKKNGFQKEIKEI